MARSTLLTSAQQLRRQADRLNDLADRYEIPSKTTTRAEMLIAECEQIAHDVRAVGRGRQ